MTSRVRLPGRFRPRAAYRVAAAAAAIVTISALAACGSNGSTAAGTAADSATGASGTLNWEWQLPTSWDPVTSSAGWDMHALGLVYASITTLDPKGTVEAGLASSWKYAANGKSVTFQLRPGLTFTDGTALNADAVKENIARGQTQANSTEASELSIISKVVVNSATSFTLDLTQVDYQVPDLLAGKDGMMVSPASFKHVGGIPTAPVGAGPFKLTSYVPDSHADLARNPGYWDASAIHLANFTVQAITQPEQILAALQSGQVNVAYIAGNQVAAAEAAGFKVAVIPSEVVNELDIQTTTAPFNNPDVVEAINYAINRQAILTVQASGYGSVAYQPFPKGFVGYSSTLANQYPYNPTLAKQLLAKAGYKNGLKITLTAPATDSALAEQIQGQLAQVGITATIGNISTDTETQYLYLDKTIPFAVDGTAGRMSPVEMLDVLYSQKGLMDVDGKAGTTPAAVSSALATALTVPLDSPDYPTALQNAVVTSVKDDPIHIWLYTNPRILAYSPTVTGIPQDLVQQRWEGVRVGS
ncbi:MAG TPA: ABC transporter substrate-binding protein [Trebonia sp.]|jgi:peptide/nickel transport system substrate-binding protein|nr:ABC transporter substrate-binding protein [Trebonia sp.]